MPDSMCLGSLGATGCNSTRLLAMHCTMFARWAVGAVGGGHGRELHRSDEVSLSRWFDSGNATFVNNQTMTCRRRRQELRRGSYGQSGIQWHGSHVGQPDFSENSRLVAYSIGESPQTCSDHGFSTCSQLLVWTRSARQYLGEGRTSSM